jgi:hypothetical protein
MKKVVLIILEENINGINYLKIWVLIGITDSGKGIIHHLEMCQTVHFNLSDVRQLRCF